MPARTLLKWITIFSLALVTTGASQEMAWLESRTTELDGKTESELHVLDELVGDARFVFLGEASHGDGSSFAAKVRVIKYLHSELGFSVLVFESGMYECNRIWNEIQQGMDATKAAQLGVFPIWSKSKQVKPLWDYLSQQSKSKNPLILSGFDMQPTGATLFADFLPELERKLEGMQELELEESTAESVKLPFRLLLEQRREELFGLSEESRNDFNKQSQKLASLLKDRGGQAAFIGQSLESYAEFLGFMWGMMTPGGPAPGTMNRRDAQMAKNFIWLAQHRYPNKKFILWGATSHLSRNRHLIEADVDMKMKPMGHMVSQTFPGEVCSIGFVAGRGVSATINPGASKYVIAPAPEGSLEQLLDQAGYAQALVNLKPNSKFEDAIPPFVARPMGHQSWKADWSKVLNAIWYLDVMERSLQIEQSADGQAGGTVDAN